MTMKKLFSVLLAGVLTSSALLAAPLASAQTDRLIIENGNSASSNEAARQSKEQWNDTRNLRNKVNTRVEKEFDKADRAFDTRDSCEKSYNVNAYWEPNTLRCLDRRTGRPVAP
jgi:Ni/Co efflux regulator RcnB